MKIICVCPDSFASNTYLLVSGSHAFAVDPSVSVSAIERRLKEENASLCGIILTHGHFDHTIAVDTLRDRFKVPLFMHENDAPMLTNGRINGFYDFYGKECVHSPADRLIHEGDVLTLGGEEIKVLHTPGHSPGSVCYACKDGEKDFLITGDTLFASSIGRCDLWMGNDDEMRASIKRLSTFNTDIVIYPGHGPQCSLGTALKAARYYIDF